MKFYTDEYITTFSQKKQHVFGTYLFHTVLLRMLAKLEGV